MRQCPAHGVGCEIDCCLLVEVCCFEAVSYAGSVTDQWKKTYTVWPGHLPSQAPWIQTGDKDTNIVSDSNNHWAGPWMLPIEQVLEQWCLSVCCLSTTWKEEAPGHMEGFVSCKVLYHNRKHTGSETTNLNRQAMYFILVDALDELLCKTIPMKFLPYQHHVWRQWRHFSCHWMVNEDGTIPHGENHNQAYLPWEI